MVADGDGGGSLGASAPLRRMGWTEASAVPRGEVVAGSPVLLPASEPSSGICTRSRGRAAPSIFKLLEREGGVNPSGMVETEPRALGKRAPVLARWGIGGEFDDFTRDTAPTSTDCARLLPSSLRWASAWNESRCCPKMDPLSSMGVNILPDWFPRGNFLMLAVSRPG